MKISRALRRELFGSALGKAWRASLLGSVSLTGCSAPQGALEDVGRTQEALLTIGDAPAGCQTIGGVLFCATDVGSGPAGTSTYDNGAFTLTGRRKGADLEKPGPTGPDAMRFVYVQMTGDAEVRVRLNAFAGVEEAQAGVMIRESLSGEPSVQRAVGVLSLNSYHSHPLAPPNELKMSSRVNAALGVTTGEGNAVGPGVPNGEAWLRIQRWGNDFAFSRSTNGVDWIPIRDRSGERYTASTVYAGFYALMGARTSARLGGSRHVVALAEARTRQTWPRRRMPSTGMVRAQWGGWCDVGPLCEFPRGAAASNGRK